MTEQNKLTTLIEKMIDDGKSQLDIITELVRNHECDIASATKAYKDVAKEKGLILNNEQKADATAEVVEQFTKDGVLDRKPAEEALAKVAGINKGTATSRLASYCEENKISFPKASRVKRDLKAVKAAIKAWHEQEVEKERILAGLKEHYGYTDVTALDAYRKFGVELGFLEKRTSSTKEKTIPWFIANSDLDRKACVEKLQKSIEEGGLNFKKSTAETVYSMHQFAIEYHKQISARVAEDELAA